MDNPVNCVISSLYKYLLDEYKDDVVKIGKNLVRVHCNKLSVNGDFTLTCSTEIWSNVFSGRNVSLKRHLINSENVFIEIDKNAFLEIAGKWLYPANRLDIKKDCFCLFLQRKTVITKLLRCIIDKSNNEGITYGQLKKNPMRYVYIHESTPQETGLDKNLSYYRVNLVRETLRRVLEYSEWNIIDNIDETNENCKLIQVQVLSVLSKELARINDIDKEKIQIKCGIVVNPISKKLPNMETDEYIDLRRRNIVLMALHKSGVRPTNESRFASLMNRLAKAAVTIDLLEVKNSSPVCLILNGKGSTKGASFILYNSARCETLLRSFEERVESKAYSGLPDIKDVDLSLLDEEEEWQLIFGYLFSFPNLIERCVERLERGECYVHYVARYLSDFMSVFSVYYRRVRILLEPRDHLMPCVHARIYLVKAIRDVLIKALALIGAEPVMCM